MKNPFRTDVRPFTALDAKKSPKAREKAKQDALKKAFLGELLPQGQSSDSEIQVASPKDNNPKKRLSVKIQSTTEGFVRSQAKSINDRIRNNEIDLGQLTINGIRFIGGLLRKKNPKEVIQELQDPNLKKDRDLVHGVAASTSTVATGAIVAAHTKVQEATATTLLAKVISVVSAPLYFLNKLFTPSGEKIATDLIAFKINNGAISLSIAKGLTLFAAFILQAGLIGLAIFYLIKIIAFFKERTSPRVTYILDEVPEPVIDLEFSPKKTNVDQDKTNNIDI